MQATRTVPANSALAALCALLGATAQAQTQTAVMVPVQATVPATAPAGNGFIGRPIYSEPGVGLQMPPSCQVEPSWRGRLPNSDLEVWVVSCGMDTRTWFVRRSLVEMKDGNQARLRFLVLDDRHWPGEVAGDSASVQCTGRNGTDAGFVVLGAKWRAAGNELRLAGAQSVIRADAASAKFVPAQLAQVDCVRFPEREAMMRRLQQGR